MPSDSAKDPKETVIALPTYLEDRYHVWLESKFAANKSWYARLAAGGQHPRAMLIQCCDSRLNAKEMFGAEPGDLFIVRNVANVVPPYDPDHGHHGTSAAVEYAVNVLGVAHIVVVGHSQCGGVRACYDMCSGTAPALLETSSFIGRWIDILRPAYDRVAGMGLSEEEAKTRMEQEGVLVSIANLMTFPFVVTAVEAGMVSLHAAWADIGTGALHVFNPETGFKPV